MNALNNLKLHLKNKEKGCDYCFDTLCGGKEIKCGSKYKKNSETSGWDKSKDILYCPACEKEIAILEQAIAEIKKQRQEILEKIIEVKKEILLQRRYLPSKEYIGTMNYWVGDNNENRGIYVDLGGIIGKIDDFIEQLNQPKTEHEHENQHI